MQRALYIGLIVNLICRRVSGFSTDFFSRRYSQKNWVGECSPLPKTWNFPYPIYDLTKNSKPYLWLLRLTQLMVLSIMMKISFFYKNILYSKLKCKNPSQFLTKMAEKLHPLGPHIPAIIILTPVKYQVRFCAKTSYLHT